MLIALDYDDTYTRDPDTWSAVVRVLAERGHKVIGVTSRYKEEQGSMRYGFFELVSTVVFAQRGSKKFACKAAGYMVDVWIDDMPASIDGGVSDLIGADPHVLVPKGRLLR